MPREYVNNHDLPQYDERAGMVLNMWRNTWASPNPDPVGDDNDNVRKFVYYIRSVICDGDINAANWVISWIADIFRDPCNKPSTCLVLVGKHGAGKSFMGEVLLKMLLRDKFISVDGIEAFNNDFNAEMSGKILVQADEVTHNSSSSAVSEKLKRIISQKSITINPKNMAKREERDMRRFLFTTNHETTAIKMDGAQDRRYTVIKVSDKFVQDIDFFGKLAAWANSGSWTADVMKWLLTYDGYDPSVKHRAYKTVQRDVMISTYIPWWVKALALAAHDDNFAIGDYPWTYAFRVEDTQTLHKSMTANQTAWPDRVDVINLSIWMARASSDKHVKVVDIQRFMRDMVSGDSELIRGNILGANNRLIPIPSKVAQFKSRSHVLAALVKAHGRPLLMAINSDLGDEYIEAVNNGNIPELATSRPIDSSKRMDGEY